MNTSDLLTKVRLYISIDNMTFREACDKLRKEIAVHDRKILKSRL